MICMLWHSYVHHLTTQIKTSLSKASLKYENLIVMGDFKIDKKTKGIGQEILKELCDLLSFTDSIKLGTSVRILG